MKILLIGIFTGDSIESSYAKAFEGLGHQVYKIDLSILKKELNFLLKNRYTNYLFKNILVARRFFSERFNKLILDEAAQASVDLIFISGGEFIMPETISQLKKRAKVFVYYADNPYSPHYASRPEHLLTAAEADVSFVWGIALAKKMKNDGINSHFLPFAWDENLYSAIRIIRSPLPVVTFVGGWDKEREIFLNAIAKEYPLKIWGHEYWATRASKYSKCIKCYQGFEVRNHKAAEIYNSHSVNLNILRTQHYVNGLSDGLIMRNFEIPGSMGFALSTKSESAEVIFPSDFSGGYFESLEQCLVKIEYYLTNLNERHEIITNAYNSLINNHKYSNRAIEILKYL